MDYPKSLPGIGLVGGKFADANAATGAAGSWISAVWANSVMDELLNVITAAGIDPSEADNGQILKAMRALAMPIYATAPATNVGPLVYVIDRQQILHWQTVGTFTGYVSPDVGRFVWGTSVTARPDEVDLIGQTVDRTNARFRALIAWAEVNGHMIASGAWAAGTFKFSVISGNNVRLPDLRNQFIRATGTDADTANARALGSVQSDALRRHSHMVNFRTNGDASSGEIHDVLKTGGGYQQPTSADGGSETRPINVSLHPRIQI
ncbi:hypothetical protein [Alcaligenes aquatilis]|uniref:Phage tail protein n=1 Tax=Alcaligenes aquatilis TaxID=323284 RepID=A0A3G2HXK3_9BURK|nr:hypothetical protein [Alcaligenes aquatilis]AYN21581.1 hypothetical protein D3M96_14195 [Alcaligenes aquatilis]